MFRKSAIHFFIMSALILTTTINAQVENKNNSLLEYGAGARASVLKASYAAIANDYSTTLWNPAGMTSLDGMTLGVMHYTMPLDRQLNFLSFILPISQTTKIGVSWQGFLINDIQARNSNTMLPDYTFKNIDEAFWLSISQYIMSGLSLGLNVKYLHQGLNDINAKGVGVDLGLIYSIRPRIKIGYVFYDIGSQLKWATGHTDQYNQIQRLAVSCQVSNAFQISVAQEFNNLQSNQLSIGTEVKLAEPVNFRIGYQDEILSVGSGFIFRVNNIDLNLNYALSKNKLTDQLSHTFDLSLSFRKPSTGKIQTAKLPSGINKVKSRPVLKKKTTTVKKQTTTVKKQSLPLQKTQFIMITCKKLNVRSGPGTNTQKVASVSKGQKFKLIAKKTGWLNILYAKNKTGWISNQYAQIIKND